MATFLEENWTGKIKIPCPGLRLIPGFSYIQGPIAI
jgi:hypothetical protein